MRYADREVFLPIADEDIVLPVDWMGIPVGRKSAAELAARRRWISNWERMLPIINLTCDSVNRQHLSDIKRYVKGPVSLTRIEREFVTSDPTSIRGAPFI